MQTKDHKAIRDWIRERKGKPALVRHSGNGIPGLLSVKFKGNQKDLETLSWSDFFEIFDDRDLTFFYSTERDNMFNKFIYDDDE